MKNFTWFGESFLVVEHRHRLTYSRPARTLLSVYLSADCSACEISSLRILRLERVLDISSLQRTEDPDVKGGNYSLNRGMSNRGNDQKILSTIGSLLATFWQSHHRPIGFYVRDIPKI